MPEADISSDYRSDGGRSKYPRLKLQAGEKARVVIAGKPCVEYVHRLEAPNIVNMAPTYKKIKDRDGQERFVVETRFVSGPICHGDFETLRERHVDDKNCLACSMARDRPDIFRTPQPKYAVPILRYALRPGGGWNDIASPYGVSALVWLFGGKVMDKLIDIRSLGPAYEDIRLVDLMLECDDANFQKPYSNGEFLAVAPAVWTANDQTRRYTLECLAANGASPEDLSAAIGRRVKEDWLADDVSRVIQRWDVVRAYEARGAGGPAMGAAGFGAETLGQGLATLQGQYATSPPNGFVPQGSQGYAGAPPQPAQPAGGVNFGMLGGNVPSPVTTEVRSPGGPAGYNAGYVEAAQRAAAAGQNPVAAAFESATAVPGAPPAPQWQPPGVDGDMFAFPTTPATPTVPAPPAAPTGSVPSAAPAAVFEQPAFAPGAADPFGSLTTGQPLPPQGLSGLQEFMAATTSNPDPSGMPSQPPESPVPPAPPVPADRPPFTFDDLAAAARQAQP